MPHICNSRSVANLSLYQSKPKSRSHLALFESVENGPHRTHQSDHCNAFGYLGQSFFDLSSSCHQLVRASPESLFCRLAESRPAPTKADRNESSAIFAVLGVDNPSYCSSSASRPVSRERQDYGEGAEEEEEEEEDSLQHFSSTVTKDRRYQQTRQTRQRQQLRRQLDSTLYASFGSFSPPYDDQFCNRKTSTPYQFYKSSLLLSRSPIPSRTMSADPNVSTIYNETAIIANV